MREFEGQSEQECLKLASEAYKLPVEKINYTVLKDVTTGGFFKKTHLVVIGCPDIQDLFYDVSKYISFILENIGVIAIPTYTYEFDPETDIVVFRISIDDRQDKKLSSKVIGFQGRTLNAINVLLRLFIHNKYNHSYRILLDCNNYKQRKYKQFTNLAHSIGNEVKKTRKDVELTPMTSDERRIIHNIIAKMNYCESESIGAGKSRHIIIKYNPNKIVKRTKFNKNEATLEDMISVEEIHSESEEVEAEK